MSDVMTTRAQRLGHAGAGARRVVAEIVVAAAIVSVLMGVLWWLLAPDISGVVADGGLFADPSQAQKLFDRDALFAVLSGGAGLILAVVFAVRHHRRPVTVLLALAVCGIAGSLVAQLIGRYLGPGDDVTGLADGADHAVPLQLHSWAGVFGWSIAATMVVAVVAMFREDHAPWSAAPSSRNDVTS
jgi:hypothetical protein